MLPRIDVIAGLWTSNDSANSPNPPTLTRTFEPPFQISTLPAEPPPVICSFARSGLRNQNRIVRSSLRSPLTSCATIVAV